MARKKRNHRQKRFWLTGVIIVVVLTVASGFIQGRMANRWGPPKDLIAIGQQLEKVPAEIGPWQQVSSDEISEDIRKMMQCAGYFVRTYVNAESGEEVTVAVLFGPSRPMSVHTPDICFASRANVPIADPERIEIAGSEQRADAFFHQTYKTNSLAGGLVRAYWAWFADGRWSAPENHHFAFLTEPYLHKIQVVGDVLAGSESASDSPDTVQAFLTDFLPKLAPYLAEPAER
jgi:hypothetical protein